MPPIPPETAPDPPKTARNPVILAENMPRPRKPTELLELQGSFEVHPERRRPIGPKSALGIGDAPEELRPDEAGCWYEFIANAPAGVLTSGDRWALERACCLQAKARREGLSPPELGHLRGYLTELGATPASRSKISAAPGEDKPPANPWDVAPPASAVLPGPAARQ